MLLWMTVLFLVIISLSIFAVVGIGLIFGVVLCRPLRVSFICPFKVAGLGIRYLCTVFAVKWSAPFRKPALIALSNKDIGGLHKLWCI